MTFEQATRAYLSDLQDDLRAAEESGELTPELSYRPSLDRYLRSLAQEFNPNVVTIYEPRTQGRAGHPDWRFHDEESLGVYGYIESKPLNTSVRLRPEEYVEQIQKYRELGRKVTLTDGIEFVFFDPSGAEPRVLSLHRKPIDSRRLSSGPFELRLENEFREFFRQAGFRRCTEEQLVEGLAKRASILSRAVMELVCLPQGAGEDEAENETIRQLKFLQELLRAHHDDQLTSEKVFGDFVAQVLVFGLLYAHRVVRTSSMNPPSLYSDLKQFWPSTAYKDFTEPLRPFKSLVQLLSGELESLSRIGTWYSDCLLYLAYVELVSEQQTAPDYHVLYERFLSVFDPKTRFDYGAFYTPKELAKFAVRLTSVVATKTLGERSLYRKGNKLIDPCCGTGTFLEEMVIHSKGELGKARVIGFEILPAPYALAHYRMVMLGKHKKHPPNLTLVLTDTLSDELTAAPIEDPEDLIQEEQNDAKNLSRPPLTLVIGNPPASDSFRKTSSSNRENIKRLLDDFRPPTEKRTSRQNTQKPLQNEFIKFLRWACDKLVYSPKGILTFVLPSSFAEHPSYTFARKWLLENFDSCWVLDLDQDARSGVRASNIFPTLQGRMLLVAPRNSRSSHRKPGRVYYCNFSQYTKEQKLLELGRHRSGKALVRLFKEVKTNERTFQFRPSKPFDDHVYLKFWALNPAGNTPVAGEKYLFARHVSGLKLAPSSILIHTDEARLVRRSRAIADAENSPTNLVQTWFSGQDKPPHVRKFTQGVRDALRRAMRDGRNRTTLYSYRPFLEVNLVSDPEVLSAMLETPGGGTRIRPELLAAFRSPRATGIAVAPAPRDIGESLHRFASFCWHLPDNDLASRGNAHVFCQSFPEYKKGRRTWDSTLRNNINPEVIARLRAVGVRVNSKAILYYVYALLCSDAYLDAFGGALFIVADSEMSPRIPLTSDRGLFRRISRKGEALALLEKADVPVELSGQLLRWEEQTWQEFRLTTFRIDLDEEAIVLLENRTDKVRLQPIRREILEYRVSGYSVLKQWLKMHSFVYTRASFSSSDFTKLLSTIARIDKQLGLIAELDDLVKPLLKGRNII